jgi:Acetyl esterase (deacetylase)
MSFSVSRFHRALAVFLLALAGTALAAPTFTPFDPSGLYAPGEKVGWTVTFSADDTQSYTYQIKKNNFTPLASGTLDPAAGTATLETVLDEPAMVYVEITPTYAPADTPPLALGAAIAPEQIAPAEPPPDDFDAFWREKIAQLHEIPADPQLIPGDSGVEGVEYATLRMNNIAGAHIYGQLAKPSKPGKYPALLILQWAGGPYPLQKSWVTEPAAEGWLALNIEPHDVPGDMPPEFYAALPALLRRYNTIYDDDRDRNYFLQMYLGAYRAADYLAQHPDWNGEVFLVRGTSMGGQQALALAGLHSKPTHVIVHVPAGADANGNLHGRTAGYPNWNSHNPAVARTARYFDTVYFASRIQARALVSMGFLDTICPPVGIWAAFNQIPAPKEVVPLPEAAHNHQATPEQQQAFTDRENAWRTALVRGAEPRLLPLHSSALTGR